MCVINVSPKLHLLGEQAVGGVGAVVVVDVGVRVLSIGVGGVVVRGKTTTTCKTIILCKVNWSYFFMPKGV